MKNIVDVASSLIMILDFLFVYVLNIGCVEENCGALKAFCLLACRGSDFS